MGIAHHHPAGRCQEATTRPEFLSSEFRASVAIRASVANSTRRFAAIKCYLPSTRQRHGHGQCPDEHTAARAE